MTRTLHCFTFYIKSMLELFHVYYLKLKTWIKIHPIEKYFTILLLSYICNRKSLLSQFILFWSKSLHSFFCGRLNTTSSMRPTVKEQHNLRCASNHKNIKISPNLSLASSGRMKLSRSRALSINYKLIKYIKNNNLTKVTQCFIV